MHNNTLLHTLEIALYLSRIKFHLYFIQLCLYKPIAFIHMKNTFLIE